MKRFILIVLSLVPCLSYGADDCKRATEIVIQAFDLGLTPQVHEQQQELLKQALALCPNHAEAHNNFASILEMEKKYDKALFHYKEAIRIKPDFAVAYFGLGEIYSKTGRYPQAVEAYLKAIDEDEDALEKIKMILQTTPYKESLKGHPIVAEAWFKLGENYYVNRQFPLALEAYLNICDTNKNVHARITNLLKENRFMVSEAGEIMNKESLLLLFDKKRRNNIRSMLSKCHFKASMVYAFTFRNLLFEVGSAKIKDESVPQLKKISAALHEVDVNIKINGHTDKQPFKGYSQEESDKLNMKLSRDRAKSVADYLLRLGVSQDRLQTEGFGPKVPVAYEDSPDAYAKNRRVVIGVGD